LTVTRAFKIGLGWSRYAAEDNAGDPSVKAPYRAFSETAKSSANTKPHGLAASTCVFGDKVWDTFSKTQHQAAFGDTKPSANAKAQVSASAIVNEACKPVGLETKKKKTQQGIRILG
jgi:hypothetical protein